MGPAIIQHKTLTDDDHAALLWFSVVLSVTMAGLFAAGGWILEWVYGGAVYREVAWLLAIAVLCYGLSVVPKALLMKAKDFRQVNLIAAISSLVGGVAGVWAAFGGWGVFALPTQTISTGLLSFALMFWKAGMRPRAVWSLEPLRRIWGFAGYQMAFSIVGFFTRNVDSLLIGKLLGPTALGNYDKSYQLMSYPNQIVLGVVQPVMHPILSDYQDDVATIRRVYLRMIHLLALLGLPLSVLCSLSSREIVLVLFGDQWGAAVFPFSMLGLTIWCQLTLTPTGPVYQARNKTKAFFLVGLGSMVFIVSSILVGLAFGGIDQVAISLTIGFIAQWFAIYAIMAKVVLDTHLGAVLRQVATPALIAAISALPLLAVNCWLPEMNEIAGLAIRVVVWGITVLAVGIALKEHRVVWTTLRPENAHD
jgi:O-antigen/teichoic acid export membrane protein